MTMTISTIMKTTMMTIIYDVTFGGVRYRDKEKDDEHRCNQEKKTSTTSIEESMVYFWRNTKQYV